MSVYTELKKAGVETDHHISDLYAKCCPESRRILKEYQFRPAVTCFRDEQGVEWFDIPFAFDPFWESVKRSRAS